MRYSRGGKLLWKIMAVLTHYPYPLFQRDEDVFGAIIAMKQGIGSFLQVQRGLTTVCAASGVLDCSICGLSSC